MTTRALPRALCAALLVAQATASAFAAATPLQKATTLVKPAVVYVSTTFHARVAYTTSAGTSVYGPYEAGGTGSGFIINPDGFVMTNGHVVQADSRAVDYIWNLFWQEVLGTYQQQAQTQGKVLSEEDLQRIAVEIQSQGTLTLIDDEGNAILKPKDLPRSVAVVTKGGLEQFKEARRGFPAEVRAESAFDEKDIAILKISGKNFPTVELGDSDAAQLQDSVTVLGFPGAVQQTFETSGTFGGDSQLEVTITQGIVSSFKTWKDGSPILGTDAAVTHGNSGGPAVNDSGQVIGVASMVALKPEGQAFGFSFLRPINVAKDFVRATGVVAQQSLTDSRFREAMEHFWAAEEAEDAGRSRAARRSYDAAKAVFKSVLDLYPQHSDAGRYAVRCEEALSRIPKGAGGLLWAALIGGLVVLAAIVVVVVVRGRGSRPAAAGAPVAAPRGGGGVAFQLVAEAGPLAGNVFPLGLQGISIGRDPGQCQIVYNGDTVSRLHARLQITPDGLILTNLSTTNPTYVNEQTVAQTTVRPGDRIRVGQLVLRIDQVG